VRTWRPSRDGTSVAMFVPAFSTRGKTAEIAKAAEHDVTIGSNRVSGVVGAAGLEPATPSV
jgi:hypothetical protein